jgi:hypothetical protein
VVSGPPTADVRTQLPAAFKRRFGIDLEYLGGRTGDLMTRLQSERAADQYTLDAMIAGASTLYYQAYPGRMLDPIPPVLIHPEATDPAGWVRGAPWYMDPEQQYILRLSNQVTTVVAVNTQFFRAEDIRSFQDLLDPRYRGKISSQDPGVSGQGSANAAYLLYLFGEEYVRALYQDQQVGVSREERQIPDHHGAARQRRRDAARRGLPDYRGAARREERTAERLRRLWVDRPGEPRAASQCRQAVPELDRHARGQRGL